MITADTKKGSREARPLEFFAFGNRVQSTIVLSNPGKGVLKTRALDVNETTLNDASGQALKKVSFFARLRPGQVQKCPLEFELDPTTAPGTFKGRFDCGDMLHQPFILHVLERMELSLTPSRIMARGIAGQKLRKEIVVSNEGNVPVTLDQEMNVTLYEVDELNRAAGSTLREAAADGFNSTMDHLVVKLKEAMVRPVSIKIESTELELQANETRKFDLSLRLPTNLRPGRSYRGKIDIYDSQLSVLLHCQKSREVEK